jgi:phosphoenolpyruvate carboxylase
MERRDIVFAAKDEPLREDVSELGALVGAMLREQGGMRLYERVEAARRAAIRRREGHRAAADNLRETVEGLPPADAQALIRAFSTWFQMANLAERVHRIRRRRDYERDDLPQPEGLIDSLEKLRDQGLGPEQILKALGRIRIMPVFTAHPTESMRRSLLEKQQRIARRMVERFDPSRTPREDRAAMERIRMEITSGWQTEEHPSERPTVADEMEHVLFYVTDVLYQVVPPFYESLAEALGKVWPEAEWSPALPRLLRFGSWVGGDMDGNPLVTADTVRATLREHRRLVLQAYHHELGELYRRLSQSLSRIPVSEALLAAIEHYGECFPDVLGDAPVRHREMPYRVMTRMMQARLNAVLLDGEGAYESVDEFLHDVGLMADSLSAHCGRHAGAFAVHRLRIRAETFGFHLASLDVRQDALVHREAVGRLLGESGWLEREPAERAARMRELLESGDPPPVGDTQAGRVLDVFRALAEGRARYGEAAVGAYIVSMTRGPEDMLAVMLLARWAGLVDTDGRVPLDVVPLLETVPDLQNGPGILREMLEDPGYRTHLDGRGGSQVLMVGYSDSNKESGIAASRWAVQQAQESLVAVADAAGVQTEIFHGRGGSASRGGGKIHRAVLASAPGAMRGRLRLTEQGEVIHTKYGLRSIAMRSLEQTLGAVMRASQRSPEAAVGGESGMMDRLAEESRRAYRELVYDNEAFEPFFREFTPIDVIETMAMGSRPASRRGGHGIDNLRAIPWVFAWTQTRLLLPGWYGLGRGLAAVAEAEGMAALRAAARDWPFFAMLLADVEMVLAKADPGIAERYLDLVSAEGRDLFDGIRAEFDDTVRLLLEVKNEDELLADDPVLARAIRLRNPYVDPMSLLQVDLLARWRSGGRQDPALHRALIASVNGIAQGLQNTG